MPLIFQKNINSTTKLGVWHITEDADFFLQLVPMQTQAKHPHKQLQHLAGRYLLKALFPNFPNELIRIADTRKPYLDNEAYHFSISHCGDYAAVMVSSSQRVGVDVERVTNKVSLIKDKFLSLQEQQLLAAVDYGLPDLMATAMLTAAWGIKESLFKWYGEGSVDFKEHLRIEQFHSTGGQLVADCTFRKKNLIALQVQVFFLADNCICWVLS